MGQRPNEEDSGSRPLIHLGALAYAVGWCWPLAMAMAGVASDWVRIRLSHKLWLTGASCLWPVLIRRYGGRSGPGCATALGIYCTLAVLVMWYWN